MKIAIAGSGSTVFARKIVGDCLLREALRESEFALYDIDGERLKESEAILSALAGRLSGGRAKISAYLGEAERKEAFRGASAVINAIQVGGRPSTLIDFELPRKFGLRQTIGDTLGIGGIFRALRTIPVMLDFARDIAEAAPDAWFINYTNPMAMLTGAMLKATSVRTVGLCHSVQVCVKTLFETLGLPHGPEELAKIRSSIAGVNHMAWLLSISRDGRDLYPELRQLADRKMAEWLAAPPEKRPGNMIRIELMRRFGCYVTESSEHNAEYTPYWIKSRYPELIKRWNIPLDEYPRRCARQLDGWKQEYEKLRSEPAGEYTPSREYISGIVNALATGEPYVFHGNVLNTGFIPNLPPEAVVEVPCVADRNGIAGCYAGRLPLPCAALNTAAVNVQLLTVEAALTRKRDLVYQAAMLDPHTAAELPIDRIAALCDALIEAHGTMLPQYR